MNDPAREHFQRQPPQRQREVLTRLAAKGYGDEDLARMSGLSIEMVRRLLSEREA